MASSGTGAPDSIHNENYDSKIINPEHTAIGTDNDERTPIVVPGLDLGSQSSGSDKENKSGSGFDLLKNEEEEALIGQATPLPPIDGVFTGRSPPMMTRNNANAPNKTAPNLRSVSMPKGPTDPSGLTAAKIATTSPQLMRATSYNSVNEPPCTLSHPVNKDKKAMKIVSEYYKKQNELLENFKADNEQIQEFQKTRTRQRLVSTNSVEPEEREVAGGEAAAAAAAAAPAATTAVKDGEEAVSVAASTNKKSAVAVASGGGAGGGTGAGEPPETTAIDMMSEEEEGLLGEKQLDDDEHSHRLAAARLAKATLYINVTLAIMKGFASWKTGSLSIISSLVDSLVDITSGALILYSTRAIKKRDPYSYPRGRTRLEPMVLVIISIVMGFASLQLLIESVKRLATGDYDIDMDLLSVLIMVFTIVAKGILVLVCKKYSSDASIRVLAQDHRNDCISNTVALLCSAMSPVKGGMTNVFGWPSFPALDPIGAIIVSVYIMKTWWGTGKEHVKMLTGKSAEPEFINRIIKVCIDHDPRIEHLDTVYVYHYGMKFLVEVHIVLDENMPLKVAHDISESLQINIESLPDVERAFVHTDYEYEHLPADEHKVV